MLRYDSSDQHELPQLKSRGAVQYFLGQVIHKTAISRLVKPALGFTVRLPPSFLYRFRLVKRFRVVFQLIHIFAESSLFPGLFPFGRVR